MLEKRTLKFIKKIENKSGYCSVGCIYSDDELNPTILNIENGTFIGEVDNAEIVSLKGGFYIANGENPVGAIVAKVNGEEGFLSLLAETYRYNEPLKVS